MDFAKIIRSLPIVRNAYSGLRLHDLWWQIVLATHGKPSDVDPNCTSSKLSLARGFRFYGYLYLILATTMFAFATVVAFVGTSEAYFWSILLVASSLFLACTCQLAFTGARCFLSEPRAATLLLLTFFVSIMLYLSFFCGVCLSYIQFSFPEYGLFSAFALASFMVFGIGSYFIEIVFLASYRPAESVA